MPSRSRRCRIKVTAQIRIALLGLVAVCILVSAGCRQDMQNQPKFIPLRSSEFYPDHRSARDPIVGTVPWSKEPLNENTYFFTGKQGTGFGNDLPTPLKLDRTFLARGQERYNIYCTPCHSLVGDGDGMIVQRGYKRPPSFHDQRLRGAPLGYYFDVMSNGLGAMPDYSAQIRPEDRWAIAAYIRALQLSQNAALADVPAAEREKLEKLPVKSVDDGIQIPDTSVKQPKPKSQGGQQ